jgi:acyl-CoA synthetase (AMP-forming)/AMP-acid ligase II
MTTTVRLLAARAAAEPDQTALIVDGVDSLTFGAWHARSTAAARAILRRGLPPGGRVGLLFDARGWVDYAVCFAAVHKAGGVAVPLPRSLPAAELARLLADCGASGLIHDGGAGFDGSPAAAGVPSAGASLGDVLPAGVLPAGAWAATAAEFAALDPGSNFHSDPGSVDVEVGPGDLAQILYTSGTTGRPKGVAATHANLTYGCGRRRRPFAHSRHLVHAFPIGTNAGQAMLINALDAHPAVVTPARFTPARFARTIERYAAGTVFLVPAMAVELLNAPAAGEHDLSSVVLLGSAAAPLPGAIAARLAKAFPNATIANYYTSTEAAPAQTVMLYDPAHPGSVGRAIDGGGVRIAAAGSGEPVGPGEVGEVWLRSPAAPRAYFGDAEASGEVFKAGWIKMGDLGHLDADGYLYLVDRGGDMVKSGGFKVSTLRVEEAIYEHPDIVEAAVLGVPHPVLGTELAAVVVTLEPVPPERLRRFLLDRLAPHEVPARVVQAASLPRNAGGKVDKRTLLGELT